MRTRSGFFGPLWGELQQLQQEMNHLFDRWRGDPEGAPRGGFPAVNLWEEGEQVFLEAELPGLQLEDLEILVTGGSQLTIKGQRRSTAPEKGVWHRREREYGTFARTLKLPFQVDADKVEACLENGVLRVRLAKHASAMPRRIQVKVQ